MNRLVWGGDSPIVGKAPYSIDDMIKTQLTENNWPQRYQPQWFAHQTLDDDGVFLSVYADLRAIAQSLLSKEYLPVSIQATELVNEAFIKLFSNPVHTENKRHLLNVLARYMRQVLIDRGRRRIGRQRQSLTELTGIDNAPVEPNWQLFDQALERLKRSKPLLHETFQLHYFAGLKLTDIAVLMSCSDRTVKRYWSAAKLWVTDVIKTQD